MKKLSYILVVIIIIALILVLSGCNANSQYIKIPQHIKNNWDKSTSFNLNDCQEIYVQNGQELKILQLTDIHYDHNNNKKPQTLELLQEVIESSKPNIIAITGDWTSQRSDTLSHVKKVFDIIDSYNIPWAPVFGNHDAEGELSRVDYIAIFKGYNNCLFKTGYTNIGGLGNYIVNVKQGNSQGKLINSLVFMDSHTSVKYGSSKYLPMTDKQVQWYEWAIKGLNNAYQKQGDDGILPSLAFFHIPTPEYSKAFDNGVLSGENKESACPPYKNSGIIDKMIELKSTKGVFVGHDHDNNGATDYKGIMLAYGVESGWCQGYAEGSMKGGTLIGFDAYGKINLQRIASNKFVD